MGKASHGKSESRGGRYLDTPIGKGGKVDDTSVVVAEIVEWTDAHRQIWSQVRRNRQWSMLSCDGLQCSGIRDTSRGAVEEDRMPNGTKNKSAPQSGVSNRNGTESDYGSESEDES